MNVEQQPAYLVHSRKYTDSKILVDFITADHGRVSGVLRQGSKSSKYKVQPFTRIALCWKGNASLKTITQVEPLSSPINLLAENLYCGLYLNELLQRALPQEDACEGVFLLYADTLDQISPLDFKRETYKVEQVLREFEFTLLDELGFGVDLNFDIHQNEIVEDEKILYHYVSHEGFFPVFNETGRGGGPVFSSSVLAGLRERQYTHEVLKAAKFIARQALIGVIGEKPIKARELFLR